MKGPRRPGEPALQALLRGALAGLAGTATMSAAGALAQAAGLMAGEPPPRKVAGNAEETLGVRRALSREAFEASWVAQHFAYGSAAGAAYAMIRGRRGLGGPVIRGSAYGCALWAFGYGGWAPALGLHPHPAHEPRRRVVVEVATHIVYGVTTALVEERLAARTG